MNKFSKMTLDEAYKYVKQTYALYNFLNNARNNDTTISNFLSNNNITKENFFKYFNKDNVIKIYNSLSPSQKEQMKQYTSLLRIILEEPTFDFDENDTNEQDESDEQDGGKSKRRKSKRRKSKRRKSKRRKSKRRKSRK
jgi:hypothetical protein